MRGHVLCAFGVLLFSAALGVNAEGATAPQISPITWMPDVALRVADLRKRTDLAAEEARARRRSEHERSWRTVAAAPVREPRQ